MAIETKNKMMRVLVCDWCKRICVRFRIRLDHSICEATAKSLLPVLILRLRYNGTGLVSSLLACVFFSRSRFIHLKHPKCLCLTYCCRTHYAARSECAPSQFMHTILKHIHTFTIKGANKLINFRCFQHVCSGKKKSAF